MTLVIIPIPGGIFGHDPTKKQLHTNLAGKTFGLDAYGFDGVCLIAFS